MRRAALLTVTMFLGLLLAAGAALAVLALTLVVPQAAMAQTASVEGESFTHPQGMTVVHDQMYSSGAALKFKKSKAVATKQVTITETSNVSVRALAGKKKGDSPTLTIRVDGANAGTRRITSNLLSDYLYSGITLQPGTYTIELKGGDLSQGRNVFVDVVSFPAIEQPPPSDAGKIVFNKGGCGGCVGARIWTMNPDGTEQQQVDLSATGVASFQHLIDATLSPDGSKIAFVLDNCSPCRLYVANVDGSSLQLVDQDHGIREPSWSPDGSKLVYQEHVSVFNSNSELVVRDLSSGSEQTIVPSTSSLPSAGSPNWSSTNKIVYRSGTQDLYTVNPDGTNPTLIIEDGFVADWSPDGSKLVYTALRGGQFGIYTSNADGSNEQLIKSGNAQSGPTWSLDGNKIAYGLSDAEIYTMNADGSGITNITNTTTISTDGTGYEHSPDWGPSLPN
jgi:WD40-like Beta Propeller Repeat